MTVNIKRRTTHHGILACLVALLILPAAYAQPRRQKDTGSKPNILIIITDQQFADAMSCAQGREYLHTPHMDSIAANGMRFTRAYCANPICQPSRTATFAGRPHRRSTTAR